jgi:DNA-binding MarR family transcriptional regulator
MNYSNDQGKRQDTPKNLYILAYAFHAMKARRITMRRMKLLAHTDHKVNGYKRRHPEADRDDSDWEGSAIFTTKELGRMLQCDTATVRACIEDLCKKEMMKARKLDKNTWELKTRPNRESSEKDHYIRSWIIELFESGKITPSEMLLLSKVDCFERDKKVCYMTNEGFAEWMGTTTCRVEQIIASLVEKKYLRSKVMTNDRFHKLLGKKPRRYKLKSRWRRLLTCTIPE